MKLPSIQQVAGDTTRTIRRFPLVILNAAVGTMVAVVLIDHEGANQPSVLFKILHAAILGMPLFIGLALLAEKRGWSALASVALQAAGVAALAGYAWSVPSDLADAPVMHMFRLLMIAVSLHLFVAVAPYIGKGETNGFWHFNKTLLLRGVTTAIFAGVLFAGLAVALAALDNLFGINVPATRYAELWVSVVGLFATIFFLGGIPERLEHLDAVEEYPKEIKIFAQYILLPLVLVYLVILYAYIGKILVTWDWPQGWVSRLILGFATTGILMHLLFYPIRGRAGNQWITTALRWFYVVLVPLVVVLMLALTRRISEYGITEGRYVAIVTGLWLGAVVLYFIVRRSGSIKVIPGSLGIVALLISFGPWGAFEVSESSQVGRLQALLTRTSILVDGVARPAAAAVPFEETKEICSILNYLHEVHGYGRIQPWFGESLLADTAGGRLTRKAPSDVAKLIGVEYVRVWEGVATKDVNMHADPQQALAVAGYEHLWRGSVFTNDRKRKEILGGGGFAYATSPELDTLTLYAMREGQPADSLRIDVRPLVERLLAEYQNTNAMNIPPEKMSMEASNAGMRVKLYLPQILAHRQDTLLKLTTYECVILYSPAEGAR
jgi:hypothetical protein